MLASELNATHLGKTVTLTANDGATVTDKLAAVHHEADLISVTRLTDEHESYEVGRISITLTFIQFGTVRAAMDTPVAVRATTDGAIEVQ